MNKYYWRVDLMQSMITNYTNFLLNKEPEQAQAEKEKIEEFVKEMARDLMIGQERVISKNKRIQFYQKQEYDNHKTILKLRDDRIDLIRVLGYYADEKTYIPQLEESESEDDMLERIKMTTPIATDLGHRARELLKELSKYNKEEGDGQDEV